MPVKLSFVIPVYNVADYLEECIDSILSQLTDSCEMILVDDGSTDCSGDICDRRAALSPLIRVVHKENGGLASARNAGMEVACGEYLGFVDSDDRIAPGSVAAILNWIENGGAEMCFMQGIKFYPNGACEDLGDAIDPEALRGKTREEAFRHLASRPKYPGSSCTKIYRRSFLDRDNIWFPRDRRISEDLGFIMDCLLAAQSFDGLAVPFYEYRQNRPGSITSTISKRSISGLITFVNESVEKLTNNRTPKDEVSRLALSFVAYEYSILLWDYSRLPAADKPAVLRFLKENKWLLQYSASRKTQLIRMAVSVLGIRFTSHMLGLYMSLRSRRSQQA